MKASIGAKALGGVWRRRRRIVAAARLAAAAQSHRPASASAGGQAYTIGVSNGGGVGNGWREEKICSAKAQALASGKVVRAHHRSTATPTRPASSQDIRDLIAKGVDAIVVNPNEPGRPQPGHRRGHRGRHRGRRGRRVRHRPRRLQPVQRPGRVRLPRRQVAVRADGRQGRRRLHARPRRPPGRHRPRHGLQEGPRRVPGHQGRPERGPSPPAGIRRPARSRSTTSSPAARRQDRRHLDLGHRQRHRRRHQGRQASRSCRSSARTSALRQPAPRRDEHPGLKGAAVTNPAAVGGAGVDLALKILDGETVATDPTPASRTPSSSPRSSGQHDRRGQGLLDALAGRRPRSDCGRSASDHDWTTYTEDQVIACKGPGE